ncbi:DUF4381 domain-containing protein [Motiliproteus sp. SC1-56]|uniref:DUF4381 domain-containing protein n=1 Tax=Motiliproteus sp. SC1-56 TaxID=2799565 RepID=UPI001A8CC5B9|nr:DUF4381 domain-containing protein [Motiliproteus sp. SC1-56]
MVSSAAPSLAQLRPLQAPPPVSWWPPAPGWWLLGLMILALVAYGLWRFRQHRRRNRYRRRALVELSAIYRQYQAGGDAVQYLHQASNVIRRVALSAFPAEQVAGLQGQAWVDFLHRSSGLEGFAEGAGVCLAAGPYQPAPRVEVEPLDALLRAWVVRHRGDWPGGGRP